MQEEEYMVQEGILVEERNMEGEWFSRVWGDAPTPPSDCSPGPSITLLTQADVKLILRDPCPVLRWRKR